MVKEIAAACAETPNAGDYIYENAGRLAAQWLREIQPNAANPVIKQIDFKSWRYTELIFALREAFTAGMITGSCIQQDINNGVEPRI